MHTILVHNQKGGVGKTTTVAALAALWGAGGVRVLVIDGDQQAHATISLGVPRNDVTRSRSTYGVLAERYPITDIARPAAVPGVHVVGGHEDMAALDLALAGVQFGREKLLQQALAAVAPAYDVALIDLGAARNLAWANGVVASDSLVVPTQLEAGAVDGTVQLVRGALDLAPVIGRALRLLAVVPTRVQVVGRTRESRELERGLRAHFGEAVTAVVHESPRAASALGAGTDLVTYAPESRAARDYAAIAAQLAGSLGLPFTAAGADAGEGAGGVSAPTDSLSAPVAAPQTVEA